MFDQQFLAFVPVAIALVLSAFGPLPEGLFSPFSVEVARERPTRKAKEGTMIGHIQDPVLREIAEGGPCWHEPHRPAGGPSRCRDATHRAAPAAWERTERDGPPEPHARLRGPPLRGGAEASGGAIVSDGSGALWHRSGVD